MNNTQKTVGSQRTEKKRDAAVTVGQGAFCYEVCPGWDQLPEGWTFLEATSVASDSHGRVYVFNRGDHPVIVLDRDGAFLRAWGEGLFGRAHGICIGPDDSLYLTDDAGHTIQKFTPDGRLLLTLGTRGRKSDTGVIGHDYRTIQRVGPPFNVPTNTALSPAGEIYAADGYGNARVHKFSPDGRLLLSWGEPGSGPGQFQIPHGIAVRQDGTVFVADRENCRIQLFSPDGVYLSEWADIARPCQVFIDAQDNVYVAELGFHAGIWPGSSPPSPEATGGRVSIFDRGGRLQARWGGGACPCSPGDFFAPHDLWVDDRGDIYVAEVTMTAGGNKGKVPPECHSLQKFVKIDPPSLR